MRTGDPSFAWRYLRLALIFLVSTLCGFAQFGGSRVGRSPIKTDNYAYNGQTYQVVVMNGQPMQVKLNNQIVVMISNGTMIGYPGLDAHLIANAEDALKAYETAKGIVPPGTPPASPSTSSTPTAGSPVAPNTASGVTVDSVISMLDAGLSDDIILAKIHSSGATFDLSTDDLIRLKKAKASDNLIKAMMQAKPAATPVAASVSTPPASSHDAASSEKSSTPAESSAPPQKQGFFGSICHSVTDMVNGRTVFNKIGLRNILPEWDPEKSVAEQFPHVAITVLSAPNGWMEPLRNRQKRPGAHHRSFLLQAASDSLV